MKSAIAAVRLRWVIEPIRRLTLLAAAIGLTSPIVTLAQERVPAVQPEVSAAAFVAWARGHAIPLPACTSPSGMTGMEGIRVVVGNARVVALGEPAHGAHEPLAFRNCLFRYLVEQGGFTAIAVESGLSESRLLYDYAAGGPGDARQLARNGFTWGFGRFSENVELLEWVRRYNADPGHRRKVGFYGIDLSGGEASGLWLNARITLQDSLGYLSRTEPRLSRRARIAVAPFLDRFTQAGYAALTPGERVRLRAAIDGLVDVFDRNRSGLIAASTQTDYDWARRNAVVARQLEALFHVSPPGPPGEDLSPEDYKADAARDSAMAENVRWVIEREGPAGRVLLFAHNGHIMNAPTRGGIWAVYAQAPVMMGQHLRQALGNDLLIMPISAGSNGPGLPPATQGSASLDTRLAATGLEHFLLDIRPARDEAPVGAWLAQTQSIRANFSTENAISPATALDAVIFLDRLTPAVKFPTEP
ncbi:erythromycin esterase family protein [Sphingomonas alpina]|uniref:erythromycin esterase family protein n=1 Tax=Sphingomonas alpina TaxID=653931 RepID=UPI001E46CF1D|nr:erythromycin esterase family protein [Sphingomonas alpina]